MGEIRPWPRSPLPGLHGPRRVRAVGRTGRESQIRRQLEAAEMAIVQPEKSLEWERRLAMTTLVTGATGFVGRHVTRFLATRLNDIRTLVRPGNRVQPIEDLPGERVY